jgi:hypothetical protein
LVWQWQPPEVRSRIFIACIKIFFRQGEIPVNLSYNFNIPQRNANGTLGINMKHTDLTQFFADDRDDSDANLECYFDDYTMNLWHVYVNGAEIFNLLSDATIQSLEREYAFHCKQERANQNLDLAIARYEANQE